MIYSPLKVVCALLAMLSVGMARPIMEVDFKLIQLEQHVAKLERIRQVDALAKRVDKLSANEKVRGEGGKGLRLVWTCV